MLSFALVNWGSSSAWILVYFLGRIKKHHDSSQVKFSKKSGWFSMFWRMSSQMSFEFPFVQDWGVSAPSPNTPFFMLKLLCKIRRTLSLSMLMNSTTARMLRRRFCRTISPTFSMLASVFDVLGRLQRWSSPIFSLPSLNRSNYSKAWVQDKHSLP